MRAIAPVSEPRISSRPTPSSGPITSPTPPPTTLSSAYGRTADVRGTIQRSPFPNLLVHVLGRGLSGSLALHDGNVDHVVVFDAGGPVKVRLGTTSPRLGEVLVAMGRADGAAVEAAARRAIGARRPIGKQLVIDGVLRPADVVEGLVTQATARLAQLTTLPDTANYEFFTGHDVLRDLEAVVLDPLATILATVRAWEDERFVDAALDRVENRPLSLHAAADVARFALTDEEAAAVEWATTGGLSVPELLAEELADPRVVRRVIYALLVTKHLDFGGDPLGVVAESPRDSAPQRVTWPSGVPASSGSIRVERESAPPSDPYDRPSFPPPSGAFPTSPADAPVILRNSYDALPQPSAGPITGPVDVRIVEKEILTVDEPEPVSAPAPSSAPVPSSDRTAPTSDADPRRQGILELAEALGQRTHYQLLGLEPGATLAQIQASFLAAAKRYHPDKLPAELADLKDPAGKVFSAISDAHRTLTDQGKRAAYDEELASGKKRGDERDEVERVLNASTDFQKAEIMLKRHDNEAALRFAQAAAEADPTQAEYLALYGWLVSMKTDKVAVQKGKDMLDRAVSMDPDSDRALYYRGTVLKRLGKLDEAVRDFRRAADLNEKNLDAVREVRLHEMRASSGRLKKDEGGGLFGGLFKKKK